MGLFKKVSKGLSTLGGGVWNLGKGLLAGTPGPANPYGAPSLGWLTDTSKFDFLKDPSAYAFLKSPGATNPLASNLLSSAKTFGETYKPPADTSTALFNELVSNVNAPSSVDAVRKEIEGEQMKSLLEGVDRDTAEALGTTTMDYADRGLNGPGMSSDIEAIAKARLLEDAGRNKADIRNKFATAELDRIGEREKALREAYAQRYETGTQADTQARQIAAQGALSDVGTLADLLKTQASLAESGLERNQNREFTYADLLRGLGTDWANLVNQREMGAAGVQLQGYNAGADRNLAGRKNSIFEDILRNVNVNIGLGGK